MLKVRLTFKLETDELWIGTKDRTEKLPLGSIKDVLAVKMNRHPEYHFLGLQLGPTERSRFVSLRETYVKPDIIRM